jgi:Protein of unknown function (DUF3987)
MDETFLGRYLAYTRDLEPPTWFHQWTAITTFAHALGRRVFYNQAGTPIYPGQMLTLLVGPSGVKKTSAARKGYDLIRQAKGLANYPARLNPMPQRMSNESFFDCMVPKDKDGDDCDPERVDCMGFLFAAEFSSIANMNSYQIEIPEILTDMYDASPGVYDPATRRMIPEFWNRRLRRDGTGGGLKMRAPGITMLACTTPTSIRETLPPHIRTTGFLARVMVVHAERTDRPANPCSGEEPWRYALRDKLARMLAKATEMEGEADFTPEARAWHDAWYKKEGYRVRGLPEGALVSGFAARSQSHAIRLATVLAGIATLGTEYRRIWIMPEHIEWATKWVRRVEASLSSACGELAKDRLTRLEERVHEAVRRFSQGRKATGYRDMQKYVMNSRRDHWKAPEILEAVERLLDLRMIVQVNGVTVRKGTFRLRSVKPGPWSGTPSQHPVTDEYLAEQRRDWADEEAEARRQAEIEEEIRDGVRDSDGNLLH